MWAQAMLVTAVAAMGWWMVDADGDARELESERARVAAESMATYRSASVAYARAHPSFEGELASESLSLPTWWRDTGSVGARVEGRLVVVYLRQRAPLDLLPQMRRLAAGSLLVGLAHRATGTLLSPDHGDTGIPVPASIPDGTPVWLATRD